MDHLLQMNVDRKPKQYILTRTVRVDMAEPYYGQMVRGMEDAAMPNPS